MSKIEYAPQSEAALQNFKTLVLLEISLLMGCEVEWATGDGGEHDGAPVLPPTRDGDDIENTSDDSPQIKARDAASNAADPVIALHASAGGAGGAGPAPAAAAAAAGPAPAGGSAAAADVNDSLTWTPDNWAGLDLNRSISPRIPTSATVLSGHTTRWH